jgi:hypothetical protein
MFKKKYDIYFETDNYAVRKYAPIGLAKDFVPEKFKNMEPFVKKEKHMIDSIKTVKACPGISEYIGLGYVIPAWCDMEFYPDEYGQVGARYSDPSYGHAYHYPEQMADFKEDKFKFRTPIKLDNPWYTYSEPGWSLLYLPMLYHEEKNWEAVPGIIDHDVGALRSPINIMLKEPKETFIKQGEPIVQVVPIYRQDVNVRTRDLNETTLKRNKSVYTMFAMSFKGWTKYMKKHKRYNIDTFDTDLPK